MQLDHAGAHQPVDDLRRIELGAREPRGDRAQVQRAVDHRQDFPLARQKVEHRRLLVVLPPSEHRDHEQARHAIRDPRPLVDAARALHQQRLGADLHHRFALQRALLESEEPLAPREELEHDRLDLDPDLPLEFLAS